MRVWGIPSGASRRLGLLIAARGISKAGGRWSFLGRISQVFAGFTSSEACYSQDKDKTFLRGGCSLCVCVTWPLGLQPVLATEATGPLHQMLLPPPRMFLPSHLCSGTPTHGSVPVTSSKMLSPNSPDGVESVFMPSSRYFPSQHVSWASGSTVFLTVSPSVC